MWNINNSNIEDVFIKVKQFIQDHKDYNYIIKSLKRILTRRLPSIDAIIKLARLSETIDPKFSRIIDDFTNLPPDIKCFINDDIESFRQYCMKPENTKSFISNNLINWILKSGAINCFKFALLNDYHKIDIFDFAYSVIGGNLEIIKICESNSTEFDVAYENAIQSHRNDIADWIEEKYSIHIKSNNYLEVSIKYINSRAILYFVNANPSSLITFPIKKYLPAQILRNFKLSPPISMVFKHDCLSLFQLLLEYNQNILNIKPKDPNNQIMKCIVNDSIHILKYLVNEFGIVIKDSIPKELNPFIVAYGLESVKVFQYLSQQVEMKMFLEDFIKIKKGL